MTATGWIDSTIYSHDVLVHDEDEPMVQAITDFVDTGLGAGGQVLVHSSPERVDLLRRALGTRPGLSYGLDEDLYQSPTATLFAYQRELAKSTPAGGLWATGTVPIPRDRKGQAAWARYESLVNEVLGSYNFHGLCTYDTRTLPAHVIAAARATHPHTGGADRHPTPEYLTPRTFLDDPLADLPAAPGSAPTATMLLHHMHDLHPARRLVASSALEVGSSPPTAEDLAAAANEVLANALEHGDGPVHLELWLESGRTVCRVTDHGPGAVDRLTGYRRPQSGGPVGLWAARQLCEDLVIGEAPGGGCCILLTSS